MNCKGKPINRCDDVRFLGLTVDRCLNWKQQITDICNKLNKFVFALKIMRSITDESTALTAYHDYVTSVLRYGVIIWGNSTNVSQVFMTQKRCIRAICGVGSQKISCRPLFKRLSVLTLTGLFIYEHAKFVRNNPDLFEKPTQHPRLRSRDLSKFKLPVYK